MRTAADDFYVPRGRRVWRGWLTDLELAQARWGRRLGAWLYYRRLFRTRALLDCGSREAARQAAWELYGPGEEDR